MARKSGFRIFQYLSVTINVVLIIFFGFTLIALHLPPSSYPFFAIFGLFFVPLLLANLAFMIFWIVLKKFYFMLSLVIIIIGFGQIKNNIQVSFSSDETRGKNDLKILTFNVHRFGMDMEEALFYEKKTNVIDFLSAQDADIVCLQEYHGKGVSLYEPLQKNKTDLDAETYYYESYFIPRYMQLSGLVIYSKYEAVDKGKLKFYGARTFGIYTDLLIGEDTVRVYNIHLASNQLSSSDIDLVVNPGQNQDEMTLQVQRIYTKLVGAFQLREKQLAHLVENVENCPYPVIIAGDFNDTPSSYVYNQITELVVDSFVEEGSGIGITYAGRLPFLRIDYIFKGSFFEATSYRRHRNNFSDHYPVSVILERSDPSDVD
jgi:endonuclease/exonuclease/phosphatase family metal-dependent hydrolase